jgi:hypothetical protein
METQKITMQYVNPNELSNAVCNIYDVKKAIESLGLNKTQKDNEGTESTISDCIDDILLFLEQLETKTEKETTKCKL